MSRYDQIITCTKIRELVQEKQYRSALDLMDTITLERFPARADQLDFIKVYLHTMRYEDAKDLLLSLYDIYPTCHVIYDLFFVSIKLHELEEAEEYLIEYQERAPFDPERLVMEYMLARNKGVPRADLILILQRLKKEDYRESWGYELAKLYHKEGRKKECVYECNDLIAWFERGRIVNKAITLQQLYLGTATIPLDEIHNIIRDKEEEADKLIEEVTRACRDLYEDVSVKEALEEIPKEKTPEYDTSNEVQKEEKLDNFVKETEIKKTEVKEIEQTELILSENIQDKTEEDISEEENLQEHLEEVAKEK